MIVDFYGMTLKAYLDNFNIVVDTSGNPNVPVYYSTEKEIGTNKYIDKREVIISSDAIKLVFRINFESNCVEMHVDLNI